MMSAVTNSSVATNAAGLPATVVESILQALNGMRYGQVTVIVQDGRVIQIDRTERHRFAQEKDAR